MPFINCVKITPQAKPLFAVAGASKRVKSCMTKKEISNGRNKCLRFPYTLLHKMSIVFQKIFRQQSLLIFLRKVLYNTGLYVLRSSKKAELTVVVPPH